MAAAAGRRVARWICHDRPARATTFVDALRREGHPLAA
jgi:hypothetical protein